MMWPCCLPAGTLFGLLLFRSVRGTCASTNAQATTALAEAQGGYPWAGANVRPYSMSMKLLKARPCEALESIIRAFLTLMLCVGPL